MGAPKSTDASVAARKISDLIHPIDRQPLDQLTAAVWIDVLDEALELHPRNVTQQIRYLAGERPRTKDQDGLLSIGIGGGRVQAGMISTLPSVAADTRRAAITARAATSA